MKAPLYDYLIKYRESITSFHMPGHKFGRSLDLGRLSLLDLDGTEVAGLDNLYDPQGIIMQAQNKMAEKYKAKSTIFITNGSTAGILASIMTVCRPGESLIVARNSHNSVWNGLILGDIKAMYINPSYEEESRMLGGISKTSLEETLIANPDAKGVLIVSPTYEGLVSDIEEIAKLVHKHNKVLIVDEAHGAHFAWDQSFPKSAVECGADIVIQSMHKSLPSLGQSALLHLGSNRISRQLILQRLQMIQTSSPSYAMMGLMDYTRAYMEGEKTLWSEYIKQLSKAREKLKKLKNLQLLSANLVGKADIWDLDISKIVIQTFNSNITGIELGKILRSKYSIQVELEAEEYIIAMSTVGDSCDDLQLLWQALLEIDKTLIQKKNPSNNFKMIQPDKEESLLAREVYFADKEYVTIEESEKRISGVNIMLYPPGIPLICIGERFSKDMIKTIKGYREKLQGLIYHKGDIKVSVLKEEKNHER